MSEDLSFRSPHESRDSATTSKDLGEFVVRHTDLQPYTLEELETHHTDGDLTWVKPIVIGDLQPLSSDDKNKDLQFNGGTRHRHTRTAPLPIELAGDFPWSELPPELRHM